jgi:hypothetical protein
MVSSMRFRLLFGVLCGASLLVLPACDSGSDDATSGPGVPGGGPGPGQGGCLEFPFVEAVDAEEEICPGDQVTVVGKNFSGVLSENRIAFRGANNVRIPGLPVQVLFPTDGDCKNGLESELVVTVPGGVVSGNLELEVNGVPAGGFGYTACPQVVAFSLARDSSGEALLHQGVLGFDPNSFVQVYGLNFNSIAEIILIDSQGTRARIPPNAIQRNPSGASGQSGLSNIGFGFTEADVRLSISPPRDDISCFLQGQRQRSNTFQIPVIRVDQQLETLGAVVNGVKIPTGIVSGPVRIRYTLYDQLTDASWFMNIQWRVYDPTRTDDENPWRPAAPDLDDPVSQGKDGIVCGTLAHPPQHDLLPVGGLVRTFTWDPGFDDNFPPDFTQDPIQGQILRDTFPIEFRIEPVIENGNRRRIDHAFITTPIVYQNLDDPLRDPEGELLQASFEETFGNRRNEDRVLTDANWAQPVGSLEGRPESEDVQFGAGVDDVVLDPTRGSGDVRFFEFNTNAKTIRFIEIFLNDPADPNDDEENSNLLNVTNPGRDVNEFHFRTLTIAPATLVQTTGDAPLVIRLVGDGTQFDPEDVVFSMGAGAVFDLNGQDGESAPVNATMLEIPGVGGTAGPGGGRGGNGGAILLEMNSFYRLLSVQHAERGLNDGGYSGETPASVDFRLAQGATTQTRVTGGAGGGGGNRQPGGDGDSGTPAPQEYAPPIGGRGGPARGDLALLSLPGGSGGGGGGATLSARLDAALGTQVYSGIGGPGGGGGGGIIRIVANGSMLIDGTILAEGGDGGSGLTRVGGMLTQQGPSGAAGGGSGGAILLQATGTIAVDCDQLSVAGGRHGVSGGAGLQNRTPGSGDGGSGWIRVEANLGGLPTCGALSAEGSLGALIDAVETQVMTLVDASPFPDSGTVMVTTAGVVEEVSYAFRTPTTLEGLGRGLNGTRAASHMMGDRVVLKGAVAPALPGVLSEGGIVESPDDLGASSGRDGTLHLFYDPVESPLETPVIDPRTGAPLSVYRMDTDTGVVTSPSGSIFRAPPRQSPNPRNVLDLQQLSIDPSTVLRATGSQPLVILVASEAVIEGLIDVSGAPGGILQFDRSDPTRPEPGAGGAGGAGGGAGGDGGTIFFANGDANDKSPENTVPVSATPGYLSPIVPEEWDLTSPFGGGDPQNDLGEFPGVTRPLPGATLRGQECDLPGVPVACTQSAGGGGGSGNLSRGGDGQGIPIPEVVGGDGGSVFGVDTFRWDGDLFLYGPAGGAGGGATPHVSADYKAGDAGSSEFRGQAVFAPGTGGGGGGGVVLLRARHLVLGPGAAILARGGIAFQSIDLGGNGGAGAGGQIIVQVEESFTFAPGAVFDVAGGRANQPVPSLPGSQLPIYEGNVRSSGEVFGGLGGDGSPGRVRLEGARGSQVLESGLNSSLSGGPFLVGVAASQGVSMTQRLGVGPALVAANHGFVLDDAVVRYNQFGQPPGTRSVTLWQGADESLDRHGAPGVFGPPVSDPRLLQDRQHVRFIVLFQSNSDSNETQSVRSISLGYKLDLAE